jgi:aryl-alcohol dehydrogenase
MQITAAVIEQASGPFELLEVKLDSPRPDEVVVRLAAVGMCHSDLSARSSATPFPLPAVLGHEGAGVVEQVGSQVVDLEPGDHVVLSFDSCGRCAACVAGRPVYCRHWIALNLLGGSRLDGSATLSRDGGHIHGHFFGQSSFATYALASARSAIKVRDDLPLASLAPLGCGVQTGVGTVLNVVKPAPGSTLVVYGAGGVGLAAVMAANLTPVGQLIAVDVHDSRLKLASELGATHTVNAAHDDPVAAVLDLTGGDGAQYAIETSGRLPVLDQAIRSLTAAGSCVVVGAPPLGSTIPVDVPNLLGRGIKLIGTNQGDSNPAQFIPRLVDLYARGALPIDALIREYPFTSINDAAADAAAGTAIKPVLILDLAR